LAIVLSILLRYTNSDCPFGIFKLFLEIVRQWSFCFWFFILSKKGKTKIIVFSPMKKGNYYFNQDVEKLFKKYMEITKRPVYEQLPA